MAELNEEIKKILIEHREICEENDWSDTKKDIRATYDTFRIQNIIEKDEQD